MTKPIRRIPSKGNIMKIDFSGIAGICPFKSTLADVLRLHGTGYEVEHLPPFQGKRRLYPGKRILTFRATRLRVVFIDVTGDLPLDAQVIVVGVEEGGSLRTADGLMPGMPIAKAERIIKRNYMVHNRCTSSVEIIPADGSGETMLGLYPDDGIIAFIGLYRRC